MEKDVSNMFFWILKRKMKCQAGKEFLKQIKSKKLWGVELRFGKIFFLLYYNILFKSYIEIKRNNK